MTMCTTGFQTSCFSNLFIVCFIYVIFDCFTCNHAEDVKLNRDKREINIKDAIARLSNFSVPLATKANDQNTESAVQAVFHDFAARSYPKILEDLEKLTEEEVKNHFMYKNVYETAMKLGTGWKDFINSLKSLEPQQMRDMLKMINMFGDCHKKGLPADAKDQLKRYQDNLFKDYQKLNDIKLSDQEKIEIAQHYKEKEPNFMKENEDLQERLENVIQKLSSKEIRQDPGLKNLEYVGVDVNKFVTLKRMFQEKVSFLKQLNQTVSDWMATTLNTDPSMCN